MEIEDLQSENSKEEKCDICGGDTGEDEFGPFNYPHKIGCPEDPSHPPWLD